MTAPRQDRPGQSVEDYCRQCHEDRIHTIIVVDGNAQPLRVTCDFCRSEHNFRGGPRNNPRATESTDRTFSRATESTDRTFSRATESTDRIFSRATESTEHSDFKPT